MKHLINIAGFIFFAAALFSCTQEVQLQEEHFDTVKVLGTKSCADPASLLVKLENGATGEQIMLLAPGVASVNRLFPSIPGNGQRRRSTDPCSQQVGSFRSVQYIYGSRGGTSVRPI